MFSKSIPATKEQTDTHEGRLRAGQRAARETVQGCSMEQGCSTRTRPVAEGSQEDRAGPLYRDKACKAPSRKDTQAQTPTYCAFVSDNSGLGASVCIVLEFVQHPNLS